jgi:hypothetical protein
MGLLKVDAARQQQTSSSCMRGSADTSLASTFLHLSTPHDLLEERVRYMEEVKIIVIVENPAREGISKEANTHYALHGMPAARSSTWGSGVWSLVTRP